MCDHENFATVSKVIRLTDTDDGPVTGHLLEVNVRCTQCGTRFEFIGLDAGLDYAGARTSIDRLELRAAIKPAGSPS